MSEYDDLRGLDGLGGGGGDPRDELLDRAGGMTPESMVERAEHEIAASQANADYLAVFGTPAGIRVLQDLRARFVAQPGFVPGDPVRGPDFAIYRDGQRSVIQEIHEQLNLAKKRR